MYSEVIKRDVACIIGWNLGERSLEVHLQGPQARERP